MTTDVLPELLSSLGLGMKMIAAVVLLTGALTLFRWLRIGKAIGAAATTGMVIATAVLATFGLVIGLGWASPRPGRMLEHGKALGELVAEHGPDILRTIFDLVDVMTGVAGLFA